jgi:hypothetical protein
MGRRAGEGAAELGARGDAEFRKHSVEVGGDGAVGEIEGLADLAVALGSAAAAASITTLLRSEAAAWRGAEATPLSTYAA